MVGSLSWRSFKFSQQLFFQNYYLNFFKYCRVLSLKIHWRLLTILKTINKILWFNVFQHVKVCIFWKCTQYTIHWDKTKMLKKFPSDKINGTKNALFFLSQVPAHHSSTFNLWFLYESKHKIRLSKIMFGIFHFQFRFVFIKIYIFVQQNAWTLWL